MNIHIVNITKESKEIDLIKHLYTASFPAHERRPLLPLLQDQTGHGEILAFYEQSQFCGFACLLTSGNISHIIYFAIEEALRHKGYGTAILHKISELKNNHRIIVDIETENIMLENNLQRIKRKQFYLRNGFIETEVNYHWRNESYEILSFGGTITTKDFHTFWETIYSDSEALTIY